MTSTATSWLHRLVNPTAPPDPDDEDVRARLPESTTPRSSHDVEAALRQPLTRGPTDHFTPYQFFYIFILDGLGAMILSGGINFAIAYAMYTSQDTARHPIRLFQLPNTLAGDCAVTIIVQSLITWFIEYFLVNRDIRVGGVQPIGFLPQPTKSFVRRIFFLDQYTSAAKPGPPKHWPAWVAEQAIRAFVTAVVGFLVFWGPSVGILTAFGTKTGGDWVYGKTWVPQVFKMILGGLLSLVQTPVYACFWLAREGWMSGDGDTPGDSDEEA